MKKLRKGKNKGSNANRGGGAGDDDGRVGYGRPPVKSQFKKGKSGNPKGRPKGSTNLATDLEAELNEKVIVREGGRPTRVTKQRALIKALFAKAFEGNVRALSSALDFGKSREGGDDQDQIIQEEELAILRKFAPRLLKRLKDK